MKVYLVNMPFLDQEYVKFSEKWEYIEDEYIGINIIHHILENSEYTVIENHEDSIKEMINEIGVTAPDIVMISVMQTSALLTSKFIKNLRINGYCGKIFIGGWFAKLSWKYIFENNWDVDYVCYTDAEGVLPEWIKNSEKNIMGLASKDNYKKQIELIKNNVKINNIWPSNYVTPKRQKGRKTYRLETSRGCPHASCTFCSLSCSDIIKEKWKPIPYDVILSEIRSIYGQYDISRFSITDDDMLGPIEGAENKAKEFCNAIKTLPFDIKFSTSISVRAATNVKILDYLQDCGLEQLGVGFESVDEEQLKRYNKQQTLAENYMAAKNIVSRKINMIPGLITFDPFVTTEAVGKNLKFLFDNLKHYDLGKLTKRLHVITGTPIANLVEREGLLVGDYLNYEYKFKYKETQKLYNELSKYTEMVTDLQKIANSKDDTVAKRIREHHRNVANCIISGKQWEDFAKKEICEINKYLEVKLDV